MGARRVLVAGALPVLAALGTLLAPGSAAADTAGVSAAVPCGYTVVENEHRYRNCDPNERTIEVVMWGPIPNEFVCVPPNYVYKSTNGNITDINHHHFGCP
jgi:hypothetical protein